MCCGKEREDAVKRMGEGLDENREKSGQTGFSEQDDLIAIGLLRGEGWIGCHLNRRLTRYGRHPELVASVTMCDRNSVEIVARAFGSKVYHNGGGKCRGGTDAWQTRIFCVNRVKEKIGGWIGSGLLRGEKMDQYFDALAKCRRAREVFLKEETYHGRPRQVF